MSMFASRIASSMRVAMPYAAWAGYAIQLGYVGYNLFQYYQHYCAQVERDSRNGCERSLNDTIELVIKPRRKRRIQDGEGHESNDAAPGEKPQPSENHANVTENDAPSTVETDAIVENGATVATVTQNVTHRETNPEGNDVTCVYDSRSDQDNHQPASTSNENACLEQPTEERDDEIFSNASTSLESTDSNKGIIHDVYSECFICARTLGDPRKPVATLPFCMHPFHQSCLDGVLKWHHKCPVCDYNIFSPI